MSIEQILFSCVIVAGALAVASMILDIATVVMCVRQQREMHDLMQEWREHDG